MTVLIVGCGDVGTEAGLRFADRGHRVVGWRRSPGKLPSAIEGVAADLAGDLPRVPAGTDVLVVATAAGERTEEAYRRVYLDGLANLLDALERDAVAPRRIILVSSTAVYADTDGSWVDEDTPPAPEAPTSVILRAAEELLASRAPQATVLRLAGIYGPGRSRLIDQAREPNGEAPRPPRYTNRIHRDDAAAAIVHLATMTENPEPVYNGVDEEPAVLDEVLDFLASRLGTGRRVAGVAETRATGKRVSGKLLARSGFVLEFPTYREGYAAVLDGHGVRHP